MLRDGITVVAGAVAWFPRQQLPGLLLLHQSRDVNVTLAEAFQVSQIRVFSIVGVILDNDNFRKRKHGKIKI